VRLTSLLRRLIDPRADLSRLSTRPPAASNDRREGIPERRVRLRHIVTNVPLLVGGLIVFLLFIGVLFGPVLAPENPYLRGRRVLEYVNGTFRRPPFPPSPEHLMGTDELGRDTFSMLLYGTRNTLVAATFITMARLALGLVLGGLAGWNKGRTVDRIVLGAIQMLAALPMLLLAVILILALDVRRGLPVFIIALCTIGWGEIAQYVRAEFIRIKQEPFLDSGRVIGLTPLELAIRHVLPNIVPTLIVITLLEMGAVLMILGELGFVGVYIGGGISIQMDDVTRRDFFAVPEWGAMMAGSRAWARSRPWMVMFPAIAFFVAVTGFNLLGEGLRRLIDRGVFNTAVLLSWRVLVAAAIVTAASIYVIMTLGPAPSYRNLAQQINQADMMQHIAYLADPTMKGRAPGSPEARRAAEYIAHEFENSELSPLPGGWLQEVAITMLHPVTPPTLALVDSNGQPLTAFTRLVDYGESVERHGGSGQVEAPVTLVIFASDSAQRMRRWSARETYAAFRGLDLQGQIVMFVSDNAPYGFDTEGLIRGAEGALIVSGDVKPRDQVLSDDCLDTPALPVFRITPQTANAILATDGLDMDQVRAEMAALEEREQIWSAHPLTAHVQMELQLSEPQSVTMYNVLGLLNGADATLADDLVIVSAHYDGWGQAPDGTIYPSANSDASGVATLLEIARLWHEQGFQPRRSVLFAAWAGGELPYSGAHDFQEQQNNFLSHYRISAAIHLDRLGSTTGDGLVVRSIGRQDRLYDLLVASAQRLEVNVTPGAAIRHHYQQLFTGQYGDKFGGINGTLVVTWGDPQPAFEADTVESIVPEHLRQAAQAINLTLITAAHEPRY